MKKLVFDDKKFLAKFVKLPISPLCPLIKNAKWHCGKNEKGGEECCKSAAGFMNCSHFQKWFWYWVKRYMAKELSKKKKGEKEK